MERKPEAIQARETAVKSAHRWPPWGGNHFRDRLEEQEEPTSQKTLGYVLVAVGIVLLAVAVFADSLGLGTTARFGWKQIVGTVLGVVVVAAGFWLSTRKAA